VGVTNGRCAAQGLRSIGPLAKGRSAFWVFLKRHRSERGGPARRVCARLRRLALRKYGAV